MMSHRTDIKAHLERGMTITGMQALAFYQCMHLAARIKELRAEGMNIKMEKMRTARGTLVAKYSLEQNDADQPTE